MNIQRTELILKALQGVVDLSASAPRLDFNSILCFFDWVFNYNTNLLFGCHSCDRDEFGSAEMQETVKIKSQPNAYWEDTLIDLCTLGCNRPKMNHNQ